MSRPLHQHEHSDTIKADIISGHAEFCAVIGSGVIIVLFIWGMIARKKLT